MKNITLKLHSLVCFTLIFTSVTAAFSHTKNTNVLEHTKSKALTIVTITDTNFKNVLLNHTPTIDSNNDGEIQVTEAEAYSGAIFASSSSISDLTGIEAFINATELYCGGNSLTSLDLSSNKKLTIVFCNQNQITTLTANANTDLTFLNCSDNSNLSNLNITSAINLITLLADNCNLTTLNVSSNTNLQILQCSGNQLTNIDISNNIALITFICCLLYTSPSPRDA